MKNKNLKIFARMLSEEIKKPAKVEEQIREPVVNEQESTADQISKYLFDKSKTDAAEVEIEKNRWDDPLRPLDQKFVTVKEMNDHYGLFLQRIQQQMSNVGGGGTYNISDIRMPTRTVMSALYNVVATDYYIGVNYAGTPVITLPVNQKEGKCFIIKDERGEAENAGRFITIRSEGSELIDGEDQVILMFNNGSLTFVKRKDSWRVV